MGTQAWLNTSVINVMSKYLQVVKPSQVVILFYLVSIVEITTQPYHYDCI